MSVAALQAAYNAGRGSYVGVRSSKTTIDGIECVAQAPIDLANAAGVSLDVYSLARVIASEGYADGSPENKKIGHAAASLGICQCVINMARVSGWSITRRVTNSAYSANATGYFGEQYSRKVASREDPLEWHIAVASAALEVFTPNLIGDAVSFFDPHAQSKGVQNGRKIKSPETILEEWAKKDKLAWIGDVPTINPWHLMFLRKEPDSDKRRQATDDALAQVDLGRTGQAVAAAGDPDSNTKLWLALGAAGAIGLML